MYILLNYFEYVIFSFIGFVIIAMVVRIWKDVYNEVSEYINVKEKKC